MMRERDANDQCKHCKDSHHFGAPDGGLWSRKSLYSRIEAAVSPFIETCRVTGQPRPDCFGRTQCCCRAPQRTAVVSDRRLLEGAHADFPSPGARTLGSLGALSGIAAVFPRGLFWRIVPVDRRAPLPVSFGRAIAIGAI
jgi:hypothetical protein